MSRLRDEDGLSFEAIARQLGLSKKTVQLYYYRTADSDSGRISDARELYESGMGVDEIAQRLHVHEITVARWAHIPGRRGRRSDQAPNDQLIQLRDEQALSFAAAAKVLGISRSTAWYQYHHSVDRPSSGLRAADSGAANAAIVRLRDVDSLSWRAIAARTGLSPTGVRKRYYCISDTDSARMDLARELHQSGLDINEISQRLQVHQATIARWTGTAYRPPGRPSMVGIARPLDKEIVPLRDDGLSFEAIARLLGYSISSVRNRYYQLADADRTRIGRARELRGRGLGLTTIASQLSVHAATVARWTGTSWRPGRPRAVVLDKQIARLRDVESLPFSVIAEQLGISAHAVRRRYRLDADRLGARIDYARDLCNAELTTTEVARRMRVHEHTILRWSSAPPHLGRPPRLDVIDENIRALREDVGLTFHDIATRTGISQSDAWRRYKRIGDLADSARKEPRKIVPNELIRQLRDVEGMSFRRIGERVGRSSSTVQMRYNAIVAADNDAIDRARELHLGGIGTAEIASQLGIHPVTVARWTGAPRPQLRRADLDSCISRLRNKQGLSFAAIAAQLGISKHMARNHYNVVAEASLEQADLARSLLRSGVDTAEIARQLNVHELAVTRWSGAPSQHGRRRDLVLDGHIRELRDEQGLSFAEIATAVGLTASAVWRRYNSRN